MGSSRLWHRFAFLSVLSSVGVTIILISIAAGVESEVNSKLDVPELQRVSSVTVGQINTILHVLTWVIALTMGLQTVLTTSVIAVALMTTRAKEIGNRRQSGVYQWSLVGLFLWEMKTPILLGAFMGEVLGLVASGILSNTTPLRVRYLLLPHSAVVVGTIVVAFCAVAIPAFRHAGKSPKGSGVSA